MLCHAGSCQVERDLEVVDSLGINLVMAANTHAHADHITGSGKLKVGLMEFMGPTHLCTPQWSVMPRNGKDNSLA